MTTKALQNQTKHFLGHLQVVLTHLLDINPKNPPEVITVPVEAAYQVWRVTRVLSMGKVGTHVQGVPEKSCEIKPWEIFEKMQF